MNVPGFCGCPTRKAPKQESSTPRPHPVYRIDLDGKGLTLVADVPSRPFGLGFLPDGELLVASTMTPKGG